MAEKASKAPSTPKKKKTTSKTPNITDKGADIKKLKEEKRIAELESKVRALEEKKLTTAEKTPRPVQTIYKTNGNGSAKFLAALFAVMFVGAAAAAVYFYNEASLNSDCETNYKGLLSDYTELSTLYGVLASEKTTLQQQITTLLSEKAALSSQIDDLKNSGANKDIEIATLESELADMDEEIDTKESRIAYLEIMLDSCKDRNEDLEESLAACLADDTEDGELLLHPCINSYWTSNPDSNPADIEFDEEDGIAIEYFYIYLCVSCTDCYTTCDPCDPCGPCYDVCLPQCCCGEGPFDAIRLKVRVTTTLGETPEDCTQSIEVVSWNWV